MLAERINSTLRFFDLQNLPLTAYELHKYLIAESNSLRNKLDDRYELQSVEYLEQTPLHLDTILTQLHILTREGKVATDKGYYCLPGREEIINDRLKNYFNGIKRERLIRRYLLPTRHIPFVRGIALAGSQALGQQRPSSDIDLLIITDPQYMWTARTLLSAWFQILGVRRHGKNIANRFCLNHYLSSSEERTSEHNIYTAMEYTKLRPVVYGQGIVKFQRANHKWINQFFPNATFSKTAVEPKSSLQNLLEKIFHNGVGAWLERKLGDWQQKRVHQDKFVFIRDDELSFHPDSQQETLLQNFFK